MIACDADVRGLWTFAGVVDSHPPPIIFVQAWLQANYCADAFSQLRNLDQDKAHEHLWKPGPRIRGWMGYSVPYI